MNLFYTLKTKIETINAKCNNNLIKLQINDFCIVNLGKYNEYAKIIKKIDIIATNHNDKPLPFIISTVTEKDKFIQDENEKKSSKLFDILKIKINEFNIPIKLIFINYSYDCKYITIIYRSLLTHDKKIKFNLLTKEIYKIINNTQKIEFKKNNNARYESMKIGGIGICGRLICCKNFCKKNSSINIKMIKDQRLAINSNNIGLCNKLKCCIGYEHSNYLEFNKNIPKIGTKCKYSNEIGRIIDYNIFTLKFFIKLDKNGKIITSKLENLTLNF